MNRDKILKTNEYDMLMDIEKNTGICPIRAVAGITREEKIERCCTFVHEGCEVCVQSWLNEGGRKMNYKGKWYSESEIKAELDRLSNENAELKAKAEKFGKTKELLKSACEDIRYLINHAERNGKACNRCKYGNEMYCYADDCNSDAKWQHEAEALTLIGEEGDTNG